VQLTLHGGTSLNALFVEESTSRPPMLHKPSFRTRLALIIAKENNDATQFKPPRIIFLISNSTTTHPKNWALHRPIKETAVDNGNQKARQQLSWRALF
jgi:hypothetical protein